MSLLGRLLRRLGTTRWFPRVAAPLAAPIDRAVFKATGGRRMATPNDFPALMLHTTGRVSGKERRTPLLHLDTHEGYVVVGTNWGRDRTPDWVLNLEHEPRAVVEVAGSHFDVVAEPLDQSGLDAWWASFDAVWPGYVEYRTRADHRRIRGFLLRRV